MYIVIVFDLKWKGFWNTCLEERSLVCPVLQQRTPAEQYTLYCSVITGSSNQPKKDKWCNWKQLISWAMSSQSLEQSSTPPCNLPLSFIAEHDVMWHRTSLWWVGISCPGCVPSQLFALPPAYSLAGQCEKQKRPWYCVSTAQQ